MPEETPAPAEDVIQDQKDASSEEAQGGPPAPSAGSPEEPEKAQALKPVTTKELWGRVFTITDQGLEEGQVTSFVAELMEQQEVLTRERARSEELTKSVQKIMDEVQKKGESIRAEAQQEAEAEAARILERAKAEAEITREEGHAQSARDAAPQVEALLKDGRSQASIIEAEVSDKAQQMLEDARGTLAASVQDVMDDIHKDGGAIRARMLREAEAEATQIVAKARQDGQTIRDDALSQATDAATEQVEAILREGHATVKKIEAEANMRAQRMLEEARDRVGTEIREEAKEAYHWLLPTLQNIVDQAQRVEANWRLRSSDLKESLARRNRAASQAGISSDEAAQDPLQPNMPGAPAGVPSDSLPQSFGQSGPEAAASTADVMQELEPTPAEPARLDIPDWPEELGRLPPSSETQSHEPYADVSSATGTPEHYGAASEQSLAAAKGISYSGEVELLLSPPVDATMVARLYRELTGYTEVRILRTMGSWDKGTAITLLLERPMPLVAMLAEIPGMKIDPGAGKQGRLLSSLPSGDGNRQVIGLEIAPHEPPAS